MKDKLSRKNGHFELACVEDQARTTKNYNHKAYETKWDQRMGHRDLDVVCKLKDLTKGSNAVRIKTLSQ